MAELVLVHPAWFGGWCWRKLRPLLEGRGHVVHTPTLTGLGERAHLAHPNVDLQTHIDDIASVVTYEDLNAVVLVGHSSSGAVVTGVADRVPDRVAHIVYLDAFVPNDGQRVLDLIPVDRRSAMMALVDAEGSGWSVPRLAAAPWEQFLPQAWQVTNEADVAWMLPRLQPTPLGHFTGTLSRRNPEADRVQRTYVRCTRWPNVCFDRHAEVAGSTDGWQLRTLDTSHIPFVTDPTQLASLLGEVLPTGGGRRPFRHVRR